MKAMVLLLAISVFSGCGGPSFSGPPTVDQEKALSIVWEQAYGMERESRPTAITWWAQDGCGEDYAMNGVTLTNYCAKGEWITSGHIYVRWAGNFHASFFAEELAMWRDYLLTSNQTETEESIHIAEEANAKLAAVGL